MKLSLPAMLILFCALSFTGCGSSSEVTVSPRPDATPEDFLKMEEESAKARAESLKEG